MAEILPTNICCFDLDKDSIDYFKSLGLNVYEGSLGSVFTIDWDKVKSYRAFIKPDLDIPDNLHEYHVFIADIGNNNKKAYIPSEHVIKRIEDSDPSYLSCEKPITVVDMRPFGSYYLESKLKSASIAKRIEVVFVGPYNEVKYTADHLTYHSPHQYGTHSNYEGWRILQGVEKYGERICLEDYNISRTLFEGAQGKIRYYQTFNFPTMWEDNKRVPDSHYMSLLRNEDGECISYLYFSDNESLEFVFPMVECKAILLKRLFENILFIHSSDFFPDIEASRWIHQHEYKLPDEKQIEVEIAAKREEYEKEIAALEQKSEEFSQKYAFLKELLTSTGDQLVKAVKAYLEWLGFENVTEKDETVEEGQPKEEDLDLNYNNQLILLEVKGINGTSTDSECSQIDKVVYRRIKQSGKTNVHGVYIVNNQKNVEPLKRKMPPFNVTQVSDAINQDRTMIYTAQLFSLYSDIENGFITKEEARKCFLTPGLVNFHRSLYSLGEPYKYFQGNTVICVELAGKKISVGDTIFYKDKLQRQVGMKVETIEQNNHPVKFAEVGKTAIKVGQKVPHGVEIFTK